MPAKLTDLTPTGEQELGELIGLKRYLTDFSLVAERGVKEMPIWRELLTYAMLFGIADQVAEQMKELYPQISVELTDYSQSMVTAYSYHYLLYNNMKQAEERRERKSAAAAVGIRCYASTVPERAMAMASQISQFIMNRQMTRALDKLDDGKANGSAPVQYFNVPKPFRAFNVELHFDHPYWTVIKCDMDGPRFDNTHPDVNNYLRSYQQSMEELEKLVAAIRMVAFPGATEQSVAPGMVGMGALHINMAPPADAIEEIKKYKALMEDGVISQQEFDVKKRQLLCI